MNGDGKLDVVAGYRGALDGSTNGGVSVLLGNGDGTLRSAVNYGIGAFSAVATIAADFNGDGKTDIAVAGAGVQPGSGALAILLGKGDGTFQSAAFTQTGSPAGSPIALVTGDVDRDGKPDLVAAVQTAAGATRIVVLLGNGDGSFRQLAPITTSAAGNAVALADVDGNGTLDLLVADCCGETQSLYLLGNGDGTFQSPQYFSSGASVTAIAVTDWNGDGIAGLALTQKGGSVMALESSLNPKYTGNLTIRSAAGNVAALAPGSLSTAYGVDLATGTASAQTTPLPTTLSGTSVTIVDSAGNTTAAPLVYVSPGQVNYLIPGSVATGSAKVTVVSGDGTESFVNTSIVSVAPAVFTLNSSNLAAAEAVCVSASGSQTVENVYQVVSGAVVAAPINLGGCAETVLQLFTTGMDNTTASAVQVTIDGIPATVLYSGPQGSFVGLDQVNVVVPQSLAGKGNVSISAAAGGQASNIVNLFIQ